MTNSENTLLIWVLSIAGLLLAVLYSPLGSPDLYHPRKYFLENQCVNFNVTPISHGSKDVSSINSKVSSIKSNVGSLSTVKNSPKGKGNNSNQDTELNVPNENRKKRSNYKTSGSPDSKTQNGSVVSTQVIKSEASTTNSETSNSNNANYANNKGAGNGVSGETTTVGSNKNSNNTSYSQNSGVTGLSSNLSAMDSTTLLASNYSARKTTEFIDPGIGDPVGEPVPIPEGLSCLALFAMSYCIYIFLKNKKFKTANI